MDHFIRQHFNNPFTAVTLMLGLDSRDQELLEHLHRSGGSDVQTLCDLLSITRTAVRSRVERLLAAELIDSRSESSGRGRPRQIYQINAQGLHALGEDYRELAVAFWQVISGLENTEIRQELMGQVRDRLAERLRRQLSTHGTVSQRLDGLAQEMRSNGFNIETDYSAELPILRETNCPFPMLADVDESICEMEKDVLAQVLGTEVAFVNRCRDGHHCCEFEVKS